MRWLISLWCKDLECTSLSVGTRIKTPNGSTGTITGGAIHFDVDNAKQGCTNQTVSLRNVEPL